VRNAIQRPGARLALLALPGLGACGDTQSIPPDRQAAEAAPARAAPPAGAAPVAAGTRTVSFPGFTAQVPAEVPVEGPDDAGGRTFDDWPSYTIRLADAVLSIDHQPAASIQQALAQGAEKVTIGGRVAARRVEGGGGGGGERKIAYALSTSALPDRMAGAAHYGPTVAIACRGEGCVRAEQVVASIRFVPAQPSANGTAPPPQAPAPAGEARERSEPPPRMTPKTGA
jgi:hypothetical protein